MHVTTLKKASNNVLVINTSECLAFASMARALPHGKTFRNKKNYDRKAGRSARRKEEW